MTTSQATDPERSHINVGFFSRIHTMASQVSPATEAAISVLRNARAVIPSALSSDPALNPYHPNQRRAVPRATKGIL
ncbi:MAG: hypothetical protein QG561_851 [Patescibacteria group bacterium]|nr:hypothetical protein [Patescibacteria group bacterium]